jgi:hypothetical protein
MCSAKFTGVSEIAEKKGYTEIMKTARDKFIRSMETYLVSMGYTRVDGTGEKSKWKVPRGRVIHSGDVYFLFVAVEFEYAKDW